MVLTKEIMDYWQSFQKESGIAEPLADALSFGDNPEMADELISLVLAGKKTGTSTLAIEYDGQGQKEVENMPRTGDYDVILDGTGKPAGIIRITSVTIKPFNEVTEAFAHSEGEGDRTLDFWRNEHWRIWSRLGRQQGFSMKEDLLVVCQSFELVYHT